MLARLRSRAQDEKGFTLIELLVVVLIIGILAAIAIPAFLGQKKGAQDANSKSLLRNAAIAMESYYSDNQSFDKAGAAVGTAMDATDVAAIEPNIAWLDAGTVTAAGPLSKKNEVLVGPAASGGAATVNDSYILNTQSASGTFFNYQRDKNAKTAKCKDTAVRTTVYLPAACPGTSTGTW